MNVQFRKIDVPYFKETKIYFVVCLFTSVMFALIVSSHDYLPVHPPSYLVPAEDKLTPQYAAGRTSIDEQNARAYSLSDIYATCDSDQTIPYKYASSTCGITTSNSHNFKGFVAFFTDLSPPTT